MPLACSWFSCPHLVVPILAVDRTTCCKLKLATTVGEGTLVTHVIIFLSTSSTTNETTKPFYFWDLWNYVRKTRSAKNIWMPFNYEFLFYRRTETIKYIGHSAPLFYKNTFGIHIQNCTGWWAGPSGLVIYTVWWEGHILSVSLGFFNLSSYLCNTF